MQNVSSSTKQIEVPRTQRARRRVAHLTLLLVLVILATSCSSLPASRSAPQYVGIANNHIGLAVLSFANGKVVRMLTKGSNDQNPEVSYRHHLVYFAQASLGCNWSIYEVSLHGGPAKRILRNLSNDGIFAVTPGGTEVAYETVPGGRVIGNVSVTLRRLLPADEGLRSPAWRRALVLGSNTCRT